MNIVPSLHPWDESDFIMVYDLFNVLLDLDCQYFVEDFSIYVHQRYWMYFSFFVVFLSGLGIRMMLASQKEFGSLLSWIFFLIV